MQTNLDFKFCLKQHNDMSPFYYGGSGTIVCDLIELNLGVEKEGSGFRLVGLYLWSS